MINGEVNDKLTKIIILVVFPVRKKAKKLHLSLIFLRKITRDTQMKEQIDN